MFKKFTDDDLSGQSQVKSSVARNIKASIKAEYPALDDYIDEILPKKGLQIIKCSNRISLVTVDNEILFFQERTDRFFPTLRFLHKYPFILPKVQVDEGAIRFVISGANIMCPGLTSPGAEMKEEIEEDLLHKYPFILPKVQVDEGAIRFVISGANIMCPGLTSPGAEMKEEIEEDQIVCVMAEGREDALCVGITKMSTNQIQEVNQGIGIETVHYLNDGLWNIKLD
eukprot:TRINITY_DN1128_c1_g1_i1.p1 TRINITY_DN1128_c1_g1~~TRINITY_DN1128_c1_g1_i1.p1  ORF type:complete len:240 (+),score=37.07 TRINITY_DN1128_c1_g1_i1:42-722(+)